MRDAITTAAEIVGVGLIVTGTAVLFGAGVAFICAGLACMALGYLAGK